MVNTQKRNDDLSNCKREAAANGEGRHRKGEDRAVGEGGKLETRNKTKKVIIKDRYREKE